MPSITQLEYVLAVNRTRHFGRAAEECHVSQPSLSAQVQKLEDELNIVVFDRSKSPVKVTKDGFALIESAKSVLREHKKLFEIGKDGRELSGSFTLGVIPTLSSYVIPLFVENFSKKYPAVDLKITELKTEAIVQELHDDRIDAGLLVTPLHEPGLVESRLFYEPFYAFVSDLHELKNRKQLKESDLEEFPIWLLAEGHCFRDQVIRMCSRKNRNEVLKNVHFSSGSLETLINLIRKGRGYTLLPYLATQSLRTKEVKENLIKFVTPIPTREVSLVQNRNVLKKGIKDAIQNEILKGLPKELKAMQGKRFDVIEI